MWQKQIFRKISWRRSWRRSLLCANEVNYYWYHSDRRDQS
jgi:hypothetical protein